MKYPTPADIAEMKARGYDSSTIEAAREQAARWPAAQEVERVIEEAFAGVTLGGGIGLREAVGLDDYADDATLAALWAKDEKEDWHRIRPHAVDHAMSFFDAEGMRFHLPVYLLDNLRDYGGCVFHLTHLSEYSLSRFALLSSSQRAAVRTFLLHILDDPDYQFQRSDLERALTEYWVAPVDAR